LQICASSRDSGFHPALIDRAAAAQCSALVLTLDLQVQADRHRDAKNGLTIPPRLSWRNALDIASRPAWIWNVLLAKRRSFGNLEGYLGGTRGLRTLAEWSAKQFDPSANWSNVEWVRSRWPGKLVLKGVMDSEDARQAVRCGADAIVVSNHGGRQLDGAPSSISMLPDIAAAVGRCEVLFDGGVRSGQDVLRALQIIQRELRVSLALVGKTDLRQVDRGILVAAGEPAGHNSVASTTLKEHP
jgi:L-lactate dehydrogenase (cytochrome)